MTEYEIVDLFLSVSTKQDAIWAIFFSVHMAIFGGIVYVDRPLRRLEKIFAIGAYGVFAFMNFAAVRGGQRLMASLRSDLANTIPSTDAVSATASLFESTQQFAQYHEPVTIWIHTIAGLLVAGAILFDGSIRK
ncbi:MAG: hypothetical protein AAF004_15760 [Pseudomonadota bacterium]